jgi:hypothetical protein
MKIKQLNVILLLLCGMPLVFKYRIFPINGTSYIYFLLFFILNVINFISVFTDIFDNFLLKKQSFYIILSLLILSISFFGTITTAIIDRGRTAPGQAYGVHDIVLQLESALRFLSARKNPYLETYFKTPMVKWHYDEEGKTAINPALYHFVMPPWYLVFSYPFYFLSMRTLGYFDGRIPLLFCLIGIVYLLFKWFKNQDLALFISILILLNPITVDYTIEGRSDLFALFWLILAYWLLINKKFIFSAVIFALAILSKQTIWFFIPFYIYSYFKIDSQKKYLWSSAFIFIITGLVLTMPFIIWNYRAFIDSTVFYLSGNTPNGYPISGYGLAMIFRELKFVKSIHEYYPFIIWQVVFGLPVLIWSFRWLRNKYNHHRIFWVYTVFLGVIWYTSRYFNNSHIGFLTSLVTLSYGLMTEGRS